MPKTISIKGLTPVKQRFHNEPIDVYHTNSDFEDIQFWQDNARTLLAFRQFEQQRNKTTAKGKPVTLEEVTRFLATDPDLKLEALAKSIARNGVRVPLIVTTHGTLLDGNRRYFACSLLKLQAEDEKTEMPSILKSIPIWAIEDSDIDERKKKKILAEVNFLDDLKVKWPLSVQAKLIAEYFTQCINAKKTADQAYDEIYELYGVRSDKAKSYVEAEKLAVEFIDSAKNPEHRLQLEEAVQKRFVYFWEFVNKGMAGSGKLTATELPKVKKTFFNLIEIGRIKKLKHVEPIIHAVRDEFQWKQLIESKGAKLPAVEVWFNSKKLTQTSEQKLRDFLSWLEKEFDASKASATSIELLRKISANCAKILKGLHE
jgi:hypothetical protein